MSLGAYRARVDSQVGACIESNAWLQQHHAVVLVMKHTEEIGIAMPGTFLKICLMCGPLLLLSWMVRLYVTG